MRPLLIAGAAVLAILASAGRADALTIRDIIELTRAGVGEEVLLALIEVDRGVYPNDPNTLKELKAAGVSDRVLVALVRSGRDIPAEPPPAPVEMAQQDSPPPVVVIEHRDEPVERVREVPVAVAVPVFVPVDGHVRHRIDRRVGVSVDTSAFVPLQFGQPVVRPVVVPKAEPVYWGWGGKRRPDSWDPDPAPRRDVKQRDRN
jgi:hypothetical protein